MSVELLGSKAANIRRGSGSCANAGNAGAGAAASGDAGGPQSPSAVPSGAGAGGTDASCTPRSTSATSASRNGRGGSPSRATARSVGQREAILLPGTFAAVAAQKPSSAAKGCCSLSKAVRSSDRAGKGRSSTCSAATRPMVCRRMASLYSRRARALASTERLLGSKEAASPRRCAGAPLASPARSRSTCCEKAASMGALMQLKWA
mmetsp:Transcript_54834/g.175813  ORF Transcript_54834/g.175813 Transcript_54834/m.175813 type:complete len:206 (+) Transcript_54834:763-1380(+)